MVIFEGEWACHDVDGERVYVFGDFRDDGSGFRLFV